MILSQTLGDDFLHLDEAQVERLNVVLETELLKSDAVRKAVEAKVRTAHQTLRGGPKKS
jgi:hypothetical protein